MDFTTGKLAPKRAIYRDARSPILQLAPHELAPNRRADFDGEPFDFRAQWNGRERDFVAQSVQQDSDWMTFFALADEPERGNFVSARTWEQQISGLAPKCWVPQSQPNHMERFLRDSTDGSWGRLYNVDEKLNAVNGDDAHWRLFLGQSGWGHWTGSLKHWGENIPFRWNKNEIIAHQMALLSPLQLLSQVRESLLNSESDAAFARSFLNTQRRNQNYHPTSRGSYDEWKQVLIWYSQCQMFSGAIDKVTIQIKAYATSNEFDGDKWVFGGRRHSLPTNAAAFADWTRRFFAPQLNPEIVKRTYLNDDGSRQSLRISAIVEYPTQHERLEALLRLRDWLRDKATPSEIETFLRAE